MTDLYDRDGTNVSASQALDAHHPLVGDDVDPTYCVACGFAAGWVQPTASTPESYGHATTASSSEVETWKAIVAW